MALVQWCCGASYFLKPQRVLRKNYIEPRIRARMMTGVVEVDSPVLQLYFAPRKKRGYWTPSASPRMVKGASWGTHNFEREVDIVTRRPQKSDS